MALHDSNSKYYLLRYELKMYLKNMGDKESSRIKELDHSERTILTTRHHHGVSHHNLQDSLRVSLDDRNAEGGGDVDSMVHLVHQY